MTSHSHTVMPGHSGPAAGRPECELVPGIPIDWHCLAKLVEMAGTSPAMTKRNG
jgi:hypothetical protein